MGIFYLREMRAKCNCGLILRLLIFLEQVINEDAAEFCARYLSVFIDTKMTPCLKIFMDFERNKTFILA